MPVKIEQTEKKKLKKKVNPLDALEVLTDEVGTLEMEVARLKAMPVWQEYEKKKKALIEKVETIMGVQPEETAQLTGLKYICSFSQKANKRTISNIKVAKSALGNEVFFKVAKINLTDLDKYLSEDERAECVTESRTGPRQVKFIPVK